MADPRWYAVDEVGNDNFTTSIYEAGDKGLLVARCNQNGQYPWQGHAIVRGLQTNKALPGTIDEKYDILRRTLESHAVRLMGPRSPFWQCVYCQALAQTPIAFKHKPECIMAIPSPERQP